jgi:hypothetical protein
MLGLIRLNVKTLLKIGLEIRILDIIIITLNLYHQDFLIFQIQIHNLLILTDL